MFRLDNNAFASVQCPDLANFGDCRVINCIFNHDVKRRRSSDEAVVASKRVKTDTPSPDFKAVKDTTFIITKALTTGVSLPRGQRFEYAKQIAEHIRKNKLSETPNRSAVDKEHIFAVESKNLQEYQKNVEDYLGNKKENKVEPKFIMPREVNPSPDMLPQRKKFIEHIVAAIKRNQPDNKTPILDGIDEEFKIACQCPGKASYAHSIKRRIYEINHPEKLKLKGQKKYSNKELLGELRRNIIDREKLIKYGFIMDFPEKIADFKQERVCRRCKAELKLEDALKEVDCRYHAGKPLKNDQSERIYLCCQGVLGANDTEPCAQWNRHVFHWDGPEELHKAQPFVRTEDIWGTKKGSLEAVGIDCEMGYTDYGFELLRITAIDFFTGEEAFDILVKPKGTVIDLNTRWSGVAEIKPEAVTFEDSIALLGEIIDSNTILVGHGLENDMNAMRLIHDKIVDTAVLYPRNKTSPTFRFALKQLAFRYLGRNIQIGQHDSGEDSIAAIDVTKYFLQQDMERRAKESQHIDQAPSSGGAVFRNRQKETSEVPSKRSIEQEAN